MTRTAAIDAAIAVLLFGAAVWAGTAYVHTVLAAGAEAKFYQNEFGPAVMVACGRSYVSPSLEAVPSLTAFLRQQRESFACADLPATVATERLSGPQATWKYLLWTAAGVWRVRGVSWSRLMILSGIMLGLSTVAAYFVFRLGARWWIAAVAAFAVLTSPIHLRQLPHLRDYSKGPFLIAIALLFGLVARPPLRPARLLWLAGATGAVLGIGMGFRNDVLIAIPAAVLVFVVFPPGPITANAKTKAAALAVGAATFILTVRPLIGAYADGGGASMPHVVILGLMTPFDEMLGVNAGALYAVGHSYNDSYAAAVVGDYAVRTRHVEEPIAVYGSVYDAAARDFLLRYARAFPADLLGRVLASTLTVIGLPASLSDSLEPPRYLPDNFIAHAYAARTRVLYAVPLVWPLAVAAALIVVSLDNLKLAIGLTLLLVYFGGYPAIQFDDRHAFHLNIISIAAVAFLAERAVGFRARRAARDEPARSWRACARSALVFGTMVAAGILLPVAVLRGYQQRTLRGIVEGNLAAARAPVETATEPAGDGRVVIRPIDLPAVNTARTHPQTVRSEYLVTELAGATCDCRKVDLTYRYEAANNYGDFTHRATVRPSFETGVVNLVAAPVYYLYGGIADRPSDTVLYRFKGIELAADERPCITRVSRVSDTGAAPLRLELNLPPRWREATLYQTLTRWEDRRLPEANTLYTMPSDLRVPPAIKTDVLDTPAGADIAERADVFTVNGPGRWSVNGAHGIGGFGPYMYLARFKPRSLEAGDQLIVEGTLHAGGLMVGILRDDRWLMQQPVVVPGRFTVVLTIPSHGPGALVIANNLRDGASTNRFDITRAGWRYTDPRQ
jgi:hypothetical protein